MPDDVKRQPGGLVFTPDAAAVEILEKSNHEFTVALGQVLAKLQNEITERGLSCTIRRVCDDGVPMELIAMLEHMRAYRYQVLPEDMMDETRMALFEQQAKQFLRAAIGESHAGESWPVRVNGHATLPRPTQ